MKASHAHDTKKSILLAGRHLLLCGYCCLVIFPVLWAFLTSLKPANEVFSLRPLAHHPTMGNYVEVFNMLPFVRLLLNTFLMSGLVSLGVLVISICTAYAFARWHFFGRTFLFSCFLGIFLIPAQVTIIPNYLLLAHLGLLNTLPGLVLPQLASGIGVFYLRQQFMRFPRELFEAGVIDGAGPVRVLWSILLPTLVPSLIALSLLVFIQTWNEYFWPLLVTQDATSAVVQVALPFFLQDERNAWGPLMAAMMMALLPTLACYLFANRQITEAFVRASPH